eukprot:3566295-Pleurochrysis_carterae.AAC.1
MPQACDARELNALNLRWACRHFQVSLAAFVCSRKVLALDERVGPRVLAHLLMFRRVQHPRDVQRV